MNTQSPPQDEGATAQPQQPSSPQPVDPRRRLRELLSVPERDRSDAQWDEIVELEIQLAPGNRIGPGQMPGGGGGGGGGGQPKQQPSQKKQHFKGGGGGRQKQRNKPPKQQG